MSLRRSPLAALAALSALLLGGGDPAAAAVTVSGTINSDTTWTASPDPIVHVTSSVTVSAGTTLTIEPGVTVKVARFGNVTIAGGLDAIGNAAAGPDSLIYFTSILDDNLPPGGDDTNGDGNATIPGNSDWGQLVFTPTGTGALEDCVFWFGGYSNEGVIVCDGASPLIQDCAVNAGYYGIQCLNGSSPTIAATDVSACTSVPVAISIDSNPTFSSVTFSSTSDNGFDAIGLLPTTLTGVNTLPIRGTTLAGVPIANITYLQLGDLTVDAGATLNVEAGVVIKALNSNTDLLVDGTLSLVGTAAPDSQIVLTSFRDDSAGAPNDTNNDGSTTAPAAGDWGGISFRAGAAGALDHCAVRYGGFGTNNSNVRLDNVGTAVSISNSTIGDANYGIEIAGVSDPVVSNNTIENCVNTPVLMSVSANPSFAGNSFVTNGVTALGILNETVGVDSRIFRRTVAGFANITYVLVGNLSMDPGTTLTVDPGVVVKFRQVHTVLEIGGGLQAIGAPADSVYFTSWKDDARGNPADTNGDGSASLPAPNDWGWIKFEPTSIDSLCTLDYCVVGYSGFLPGQVWNGAVWANSASPTISNSTFESNRVHIRCDGTSAASITGNHFFNSTSVPLQISATSSPTIAANTYDQNGYHAIGLVAETLASNATLPVPSAGVAQFGAPFSYFLAQGVVRVNAASILTIDPGVVVKFDQHSLDVDGALQAVDGSFANPIVFTDIKDDSHGGDSNVNGNANSPSNGDWPTVRLDPTVNNGACILLNCEFWYGGSGGEGVLRIDQCSPTINSCSFEFNEKGIWIEGPAPETQPILTGNVIRQCTWTPIVIDILSNPSLGGNTFDSNGVMALGYIGGSLASDGTIPRRNVAGFTNITSVLDSDLTIALGTTLTVEPGVVLKGWDGASPFYDVGGTIIVNGRLEMDADPGNEIVLTSIEDDAVGNPLDTNNDGSLTAPAPGELERVVFADVSDDTSLLDHVNVRYAGSGSAGFAISLESASPTITNCTIESSNGDGIRCEGTASPTIDGCTFRASGRTPLVLSLGANPILSNNVLDSNFYDAIGVLGETLAQDVTWTRRAFAGDDNREYILTANLTVGTGTNLTIQPGVVIKPLSGVDLIVRRGLIANGGADPDSMIVFTSPRDDFWGGDTNGDSTDTDGWDLRWGTIEIEPTALNSNVQFSNCVFSYGSNTASEGAVTVQGTLSPSFTGCIFAHGTNGLNYTQASGNPALGVVDDCDFFDHTGFAIANSGLAHVVSAENCWWGDDSGPAHATNPLGQGDAVTNQVDFLPFQGMGIANYYLGDVSQNGELHAFDAALIFRSLVPDTVLTADQQVLGDVTCNGGLTAFDATLILQQVAGVITTFPCLEIANPVDHEHGRIGDADSRGGEAGRSSPATGAVAATTSSARRAHDQFRVALPDFDVVPGEVVSLPLHLDGAGTAFAGQFLLAPTPGDLRIVGVRAGEATQGAQFYSGVREDGTARIAFGSVNALPRGEVAIVDVEVLAGARESARPPAVVFTEALVNEDDVLGTARAAYGQDPTGVSARLPLASGLSQNVPNPFGRSTQIAFQLAAAGTGGLVPVSLDVYDVSGRRVSSLVSGELEPGRHEVEWDGRDANGARVASGVYFYRLRAGAHVSQMRMVRLK